MTPGEQNKEDEEMNKLMDKFRQLKTNNPWTRRIKRRSLMHPCAHHEIVGKPCC